MSWPEKFNPLKEIPKFNGIIKNKMNFNNTPINWQDVHQVISDANRIMLTTHENPDGDGLGSECGLYYHFKEITLDLYNKNFDFVVRVKENEIFPDEIVSIKSFSPTKSAPASTALFATYDL